jgi:Concanavalin A-like lectin/glucanases superfamily
MTGGGGTAGGPGPIPPGSGGTGGSGGAGGTSGVTGGPVGLDGPADMARPQVPPDTRPPDGPPVPDLRPSPAPIDAPVPDAPVADAAPPVDAPPASTLTSGLISRWKLDEATGNATDDSAGNNNGTLNGPTRVAGGFPAALYANPRSLRFDGDDDFVAVGTANLPANNRPQSVTYWFNVQTVPDDSRICVSLTDGVADGSRLKLGFRNNQVAAWKSGGGDSLAQAGTVAAGWHHYAYTFDGTNHVIYVDGVRRGNSTIAPDPGAVGNARLGAGFDNAENFTGQLDEVRVYNRPLRPEEVTALFQGME